MKREFTDVELMRRGLEVAGCYSRQQPELLPTGLDPVDDLIGGLEPGDVLVVGAATNVGKSVTAMHLAQAAKRPDGRLGLYVSLEDSPRLVAGRLIARYTGRSTTDLRVNGWKWDSGTIGLVPVQAEPSVRVIGAPGIGLDELLEGITAAHARAPVSEVVVDYLTALQVDSSADRRGEYVRAMTELRQWGVTHQVPVVVCAQLRRQPHGEQEEPKLSWFMETSALETKADLALLLWHDTTAPGPRRTLAKLAKSKYSQPSETFELKMGRGFIIGTAAVGIDGEDLT